MKVLLGFSDTILSAIIREELTSCKHDCIIEPSSKEFIEICMRVNFDCIVTSFCTPFICGKDLAKKIREQNKIRRTTIIITSYSHNITKLQHLYESGIDQYLTLPVEINRIIRKIKSNL